MNVLFLAPNIQYDGYSGGSLHLRKITTELNRYCDLRVVCDFKTTPNEKGISFYKTKANTFSPIDFFKILKLAKRADMIYTRFDPVELSGLLAAKILKKPICGEINVNFLSYEKKLNKKDLLYPFVMLGKTLWVKLAVSKLNAITCVSETIKKSLEQKGIDKRKIFVIRNGGDLKQKLASSDQEKRGLREELGLPTNKLIVILSGELGPRQGLNSLLKIKLKNICFLICGGAEKYKQYINKIKSEDLDNFIFVNNAQFKGNEDKYFAASDIGIAPYGESYNKELFGFCPLKILQMMSSALPVVASDRSWVREILTDEEGVITNNFEEGVASLLNKQVRLRKGRAARKKIESELSWSSSAKKLYKIYKSLA